MRENIVKSDFISFNKRRNLDMFKLVEKMETSRDGDIIEDTEVLGGVRSQRRWIERG